MTCAITPQPTTPTLSRSATSSASRSVLSWSAPRAGQGPLPVARRQPGIAATIGEGRALIRENSQPSSRRTTVDNDCATDFSVGKYARMPRLAPSTYGRESRPARQPAPSAAGSAWYNRQNGQRSDDRTQGPPLMSQPERARTESALRSEEH